MKMGYYKKFVTIFLSLFLNVALANEVKGMNKITEILSLPEDKIDLATAKLVIDKMIDPTINIQQNLNKLNKMARQVKTIISDKSTEMDKMLAIRTFLYEKGRWNDHHPFQYDLSDPLGQRIANKLLPNFIDNKLGNCVSMPLLFIILGQKLAIDITASTAPLHLFARFTDHATGNIFNIEATNGGNPTRDVWYIQQSLISEQAINNKVYLQSLNAKETIAVMLMALAQYYHQSSQYENVLKVADVALEHYPNYTYAMIQKGNAYSKLLNRRLAYLAESGYKTAANLPPGEKANLDALYENNLAWFEKAESLGWRPPSKETEKAYLEVVEQETLTNVK